MAHHRALISLLLARVAVASAVDSTLAASLQLAADAALPGVSWEAALPPASTPSNATSAHFVLRFRPAAGSALTSDAGARLDLATADAHALATFVADAAGSPLSARLALAPADVGALAAGSAGALWLATGDACLSAAHNASAAVGADGAWVTDVRALVYSRGRATRRHRDLLAAGEWGSFVLLAPRPTHAGGVLLLGTHGADVLAAAAPSDDEWALVGWPTSTPHEVTAVTSGVRVALLGRLRAAATTDGRCGAAALGAAIDAAIPASDVTARAAYAAGAASAPCVSEYFDRASCDGAPSALGEDGALLCAWRGGACTLIVGFVCGCVEGVAGATACAYSDFWDQYATACATGYTLGNEEGSGCPECVADASSSATSAATPSGTAAATPSSTAATTPSGSAAATPTGTAAATPSSTAAATPTVTAAATHEGNSGL